MHTLVQWLNEQMNILPLRSAANLVIALGYVAVLLSLVWLHRHCEAVTRKHATIVGLLGTFLFVGALSSLSESLDFIQPTMELRPLAKTAMAILSILALAAIWSWLSVLLHPPLLGQLAAANKLLRSEAAASAETMRQRTSLLQKYETALKESAVTVFTQDRDLRYTSISNAAFGHQIEQMIGRTDADILPRESYEKILELKREVLKTGKPVDGEVSVDVGDETRCFDFHFEPVIDSTEYIIGLTCAMIDVTERKASENHLRLLMRELTHRSKNLLAVVQAIARQTARHSGSIESFLDQFGARTQALATSHDLLVQEGWYGASLFELVRLQLGHYLDHRASDITMEGPSIVLKPEAAQSLGLALHELATNAAKHGALSTPSGRVTIEWRRLSLAEGSGLELIWTERGGPAVAAPTERGFGSLVIEQNLARSLNAEVELTFAPEGLRCRVRLPREHIFGAR